MEMKLAVLCTLLASCFLLCPLYGQQLQLEQVVLDDGRELQAVVTIDALDSNVVTLHSYANNRHLGSIVISLDRIASRNKLVLFEERRQQEVQAGVYDFAHIDAKAAAVPAGLNVQQCIDYLNKRTANDRDTARIIFTWICQNITYDLSYLGVVDPEKVYADRRAVCSGFASLYQHMATSCALKCEIVVGYAKGRSHVFGSHFDDSNHAWNAVRIDGVWNLLDCTWGAGASFDSPFQRKFKPFYFCPQPAALLPTHFPEDEGWQLIAEPMSQYDFENSLDLRSGYFDFDVHALSHSQAKVHSTKDIVQMRFRAPKDVRLQAVVKDGEERLDQSRVLVSYVGSDTIIKSAYPKSGDFTLHILAKKIGGDNYESVVNYQINIERGPKTDNAFALCYEKYYARRCQLRSPQRKNLLAGKKQLFSIVVPQAKSVQIKNGGTMHKMRPSGSRWSKSMKLSPGPVTIYAKFADGEEGQLNGLVQFIAR